MTIKSTAIPNRFVGISHRPGYLAGGCFRYAISDSRASRNVHAAMLDAARICKDL